MLTNWMRMNTYWTQSYKWIKIREKLRNRLRMLPSETFIFLFLIVRFRGMFDVFNKLHENSFFPNKNVQLHTCVFLNRLNLCPGEILPLIAVTVDNDKYDKYKTNNFQWNLLNLLFTWWCFYDLYNSLGYFLNCFRNKQEKKV